MKDDNPQPPRPTIEQVNAAYKAGLFACCVESAINADADGRILDSHFHIPASLASRQSLSRSECFGVDLFVIVDRYRGSVYRNLEQLDALVFPWGRCPVAEWNGWLHIEWYIPAKMQMVADLGDWIYLDSDWIDYYRGGDGPGQSIREMRLFDAGIWTASRAIAHPDEVPFARAAWADPAMYAIYGDFLEDQGLHLTARALRRVAELTAQEAAK